MDMSQDGTSNDHGNPQAPEFQAQTAMSPTASTVDKGYNGPALMSSSNTSYGFTGQYASNGANLEASQQQALSGTEQMNVEDFSQFMPLSASGFQLPAGWETMSFPGLTPGAGGQESREFADMLANVEGWAGGEPLLQDSWNGMPGQ